MDGATATASTTVSYDNQLTIEGPDEITGQTGNVVARYNGVMVSPVWSIVSGGSYATIDALGELTISSTGGIVVQATYNGYTTTKGMDVVYRANTTTETVVDDEGNVITETTTTVENPDGTTSLETTSTTTNVDGSFSQTESHTVERQDGSSTTTSETTNSDGTSSTTTSNTSAPD